MDLAEITDFIALDNLERAYQFDDELLEHAREDRPLAYAERPDLRPGLGSCARGPYVIFFTIDEQGRAHRAHPAWGRVI
jgi:plasmid stabilization system protein ParE